MSGHNRWSKVKRIKGPQDAKRSQLFSKLSKEISVATRLGGAEPDTNPRLRQALALAKEASLPKDTIDRALQKGAGTLKGEIVEEVLYEGYGPGGVAVLVETTTDNKNRTVSELRSLFKSHGGSLAESGSVSWMFDKLGQILFSRTDYAEDKIMEVTLASSAQDIITHDDEYEIFTQPNQLYEIKDFFEKVGMKPFCVGYLYLPKSFVKLDSESELKLMRFLGNLDDQEDVQKFHTNFEPS